MNKHQQLFFLATIDSLESAVASQIKALRSLVSLDINEDREQPIAQATQHSKRETITELEEAFERSIFSIDQELEGIK